MRWLGLLIAASLWGATLEVEVAGGRIRGVLDDDVRVWRGVPFAAPPVGDRRWRPPAPVEPWAGVRACIEFGPACPQPEPLLGRFDLPRDEDCLYLNVWAPAEVATPLPVMLWIHGGGFTTGSGGAPVYDGRALARAGVVLVTINYRLGPLGFFAHPLLSAESAAGVSGNYGLRDQVAALEWVRDHIAAFGGDPRRVTIFGESAGSASVVRLMVCPAARGLFHRAIAQSGGPWGQHRHLRQARGRLESGEAMGARLAEAMVGALPEDRLLPALRALPAAELLAATDPSQGLFGRGNKFGPLVDGVLLPDDPGQLWDAGKQQPVPLITGSNADEGSVFLRQLPIKRRFGYRFMLRRLYGEDAAKVEALFPAATDAQVRASLGDLVGVSAFVAPARRLVRRHAAIDAPAWLYHFTRVPPDARLAPLGAFHSLEIMYVFDSFPERVTVAETDRRLGATMRRCWVNFAATGDPNAAPAPAWPRYIEAEDRHLEFGDEVRVGEALRREACDLFDQLAK